VCTLEVPTKRWTRGGTGYGIRDGGSEVEGVSVLHGPCFLSEWKICIPDSVHTRW